MIKSMTGYGRSTLTLLNKTFSIEIRSLNSKQADLSVRIPSLFRTKEADVRTLVSNRLMRGKADFSISTEQSTEVKVAPLNIPLAIAYHAELKQLAKTLGENSTDLLSKVLQMPEVMVNPKELLRDLSDSDWAALQAGIHAALDAFDGFRQKEGKVLEKELKTRVSSILALLKKVETLDKVRMTKMKLKLRLQVEEHFTKKEIDHNRFEQELIYYFEKLDLTEEKLRLKTHCEYFFTTMSEESAGRKLGFICQEIGREINTIGSKANDADIQKAVVQMKDELEKVKEQLMNVL